MIPSFDCSVIAFMAKRISLLEVRTKVDGLGALGAITAAIPSVHKRLSGFVRLPQSVNLTQKRLPETCQKNSLVKEFANHESSSVQCEERQDVCHGDPRHACNCIGRPPCCVVELVHLK